jgi:hypothetical protein
MRKYFGLVIRSSLFIENKSQKTEDGISIYDL